MPKYINNYEAPTIASIIKTLLFEGYEFKIKEIAVNDLKDGDLFILNGCYCIKIKRVAVERKIPLFAIFNLHKHQIDYVQLDGDGLIQKIEKCFKM